MSVNPRRILNLAGGSLEVGKESDLTLFDPNAEWTVDPEKFKSLSRNTPFAGWKLKGRAAMTVVGGLVVKVD